MVDEYRDGERRYLTEPLFKAAVDMLFYLAIEGAFTPGELTQIASMAALKTEQYQTRPTHVVTGEVAREGPQGTA